MTIKSAVVVFVKNEHPDFLGWIAWYFAIGVDTVIVYDDHSVDGTWESAIAASQRLDVRLHRTDLSVELFTARQANTYLGAIRQYRDEFDWIGFFDADEYLYLRRGVQINSFLGRFPDAGAVAISWCIYGSNGHLLKPKTSVVEAFTRHSLPGFGHNRSVKSFVNTKHVIDRWRDPHTFEIGGKAYLDPQGQEVRWGGPGGIAHDPDWSTAKIMHFIPRSMEHFIERIKRRPDLRGVSNHYWGVFDMNDLEDREPLTRVPEMRSKLFLMHEDLLAGFCASLAAKHGDIHNSALRTSSYDSAPQTCVVMTSFGTVLAVDERNRLVHTAPAKLFEEQYSPVYAVSSPAAPNVIHLLARSGTAPVLVEHDPRTTSILTYSVELVEDGVSSILKDIRNNRYLTMLPPDDQGIGSTAADRWRASEWESVTLIPDPQIEMELPSGFDMLLCLGDAPTVADIVRLSLARAAPMVCAAAIQMLGPEETTKLNLIADSLLLPWLKA